MTSSEPSSHLLTPAHSEQIFRDHIVPTMLDTARPQTHPRAVIISAQPGAGKTAAARILVTAMRHVEEQHKEPAFE